MRMLFRRVIGLGRVSRLGTARLARSYIGTGAWNWNQKVQPEERLCKR